MSDDLQSLAAALQLSDYIASRGVHTPGGELILMVCSRGYYRYRI